MAKKKIKSWYASKTIRLAIATILGGLAMYLTNERTLEELLVIALGAVFMYLRTITVEPIK